MDKDELLEIIFQSISESITNAKGLVKITATHCSGLFVSICNKDNETITYNITITQRNKYN